MKYFICLIVIFFNYSIAFGQPKDTLEVNFLTDYILKIKVIEHCNCGMSFKPYYYGEYRPSEFIAIEIIDIIEKHSGDRISDKLIKKIRYLLTPQNVLLHKDSTYVISTTRGYSYEYLIYEDMLHENTVILPRDLRIGGGAVGLQIRKGSMPCLIEWLFEKRIISSRTAIKFLRKGEEQKDIDKCLKIIKNRKG